MKKIMLMFLGIVIFGVLVVEAQVRSITGTVTDADDGTPIPGVSVSLKGSTIGTITSTNGKYQLDVPNGSGTLIFSFIVMQKKEFVI